jgi:hypothetical protein
MSLYHLFAICSFFANFAKFWLKNTFVRLHYPVFTSILQIKAHIRH